jgi:hypothetical protein
MKNYLRQYKVIYGYLVAVSVLIIFGIFYKVTGAGLKNPAFSAASGFYAESFYLEISVPKGATVYYTLDSSDPDENAIEYTEPIYLEDATRHENVYSMRTDVSTGFYTDLIEEYQTYDADPEYVAPDYLIDKCNVVRAVAIDAYGNESEIVTATYFVGMDAENFEGCNIVSVVTDPENLFDYETGIYVTGETFDRYLNNGIDELNWRWWYANYTARGSDWERPVSITFFDSTGTLISMQQGGISRGTVPRSLNLYAKDSEGEDAAFEIPLFGSEYFPQVVTLAAGGNRLLTKFNDYMMSDRCSRLNFSTMQYQPYVLFLDGEYWGFYWLAEKYDESYLAYYYGVDQENVLMIKNGEVECGDEEYKDLYLQMQSEITDLDLSQTDNYEYACELVDIDSFIDYYATMAYIARSEDWPLGNFALWRTVRVGDDSYSDGKWRWMLFDCNSTSMKAEIVNDDNLAYIIAYDALFASFWENAEFRDKFQTRILEIADECFASEEMDRYIDEYDESMRNILVKSWTRFHGIENNKLEEYEQEMAGYRTFFEERKAVVESWFE